MPPGRRTRVRPYVMEPEGRDLIPAPTNVSTPRRMRHFEMHPLAIGGMQVFVRSCKLRTGLRVREDYVVWLVLRMQLAVSGVKFSCEVANFAQG